MVFSSLVFLCIFLPIVFLGHTILPGIRAKNAMLLLASLVFYAYGEPVYVVLMIASALCNYLFALWIERFQDQKKWIVSVAVILNLALLVIFKYAGFLTESVNTMFGTGFPVPDPTPAHFHLRFREKNLPPARYDFPPLFLTELSRHPRKASAQRNASVPVQNDR